MAKVETERFFGKKGIIIMMRDGNKMVSAIFKDKKNADKYNRNNPADVKKLLQLAKKTKFPKAIDEDTDVGHQDDEPNMLKSTALEIMEYGKKLMDKLDKYDDMEGEVDFPNWWQSKLTLARDYVSKAYHYLDSEEKTSENIDRTFRTYADDEGDDEGPVDEAYLVAYGKGPKPIKPAFAAYADKKMAQKFMADMKKDGYKVMMTQKKIRGVDESVNEASMDWEKNFKWANDKELKVISKFIFMNDKGIDGVIKMSKHKPFAFRRTIQKMAKKGLHEGKKRYNQKDGVGKSKYVISYHDGKKKHKDGSDFFDIQIFRNKKDLAKFVNTLHKGGYKYGFGESINEASREAMGIAGFTGTRGSAVQKFIDDYNLNARKLFNFVKKGKLKDRLDFVTAIAGKPGNKFQGKMVGMFGESVNEEKKCPPGQYYCKRSGTCKPNSMREDKSQISKIKKQAGKKEIKFYDILSKLEKKMGKKKYRDFLVKSLKDFKINGNHYDYRTNAAAEEKLFQLAK